MSTCRRNSSARCFLVNLRLPPLAVAVPASSVPISAIGSSAASAAARTFESICSVRSGSQSSSMSNPLAVERVFDTGGRLGPVGDGDHHRRGGGTLLHPVLGGHPPVVAEQVVAVRH